MTTLQAAAQADHLVVRRGRRLELLTIGWNLVEAIVSVGAGVIAGSVSLVAFGFALTQPGRK